MAIDVNVGTQLTRRDHCVIAVGAMIKHGLTSEKVISPFNLADMILASVESAMEKARATSDYNANDSVSELVFDFAEDSHDFSEVAAVGDRILAIASEAFDLEWSGQAA